MEEKTFNLIKTQILGIMFIMGFVIMGFGAGRLIGALDMSHTFTNEYYLNISITSLDCPKQNIWISEIYETIIDSLIKMVMGFTLLVFGALFEKEFKYKRKRVNVKANPKIKTFHGQKYIEMGK